MPIEDEPGFVRPGFRPPETPLPPGYAPPIGQPQPRPGTGPSNVTPPGSEPTPSDAPMQGFDGFFGFFLLLLGMK